MHTPAQIHTHTHSGTWTHTHLCKHSHSGTRMHAHSYAQARAGLAPPPPWALQPEPRARPRHHRAEHDPRLQVKGTPPRPAPWAPPASSFGRLHPMSWWGCVPWEELHPLKHPRDRALGLPGCPWAWCPACPWPSCRRPQGPRRFSRSLPAGSSSDPSTPQSRTGSVLEPQPSRPLWARASPLAGAQDVQDVGEEVMTLHLGHRCLQLPGLQELGHQDAQAVLVRELRREDLKDGLAGGQRLLGPPCASGVRSGCGTGRTRGKAGSVAVGTRARHLGTCSGSAAMSRDAGEDSHPHPRRGDGRPRHPATPPRASAIIPVPGPGGVPTTTVPRALCDPCQVLGTGLDPAPPPQA